MSAVREIGKGYYALDTEGITTIDWKVGSAVRDAFENAEAEPPKIQSTDAPAANSGDSRNTSHAASERK